MPLTLACENEQEENSSMRRATLAAAALLGFGSVQLTTLPALAEYGAIAWDKETGKRGWSWSQQTQSRADELALSECGATGCKIIMRTGRRECAAMATNETGKYVGAAARRDREAARLAALKDCEKGKAGECIIRVTDCNK
jgi:Domain of unknown function (DUF4189)